MKKCMLLFMVICLAGAGGSQFTRTVHAEDSNTYEAEADGNVLSGNASVSDSPAASGGRKVGGMYQGSSLLFNQVTVSTAGDYKVTVYYFSGDPRPFNISANGGAVQFEEPPGTADWDTAGAYELTLTLNAGANTILIDDNNWYSPDIDKIVIGGLVTSGPGEGGGGDDWVKNLRGTIIEAEAPGNLVTGKARIADSSVSSGGQKVTDLYQNSSLQFTDVTVPAAGTYLIRISYISGDPRPVYMQVNQGPDEMLDLPRTASWNTVGTYDAEAVLQAGLNTITFSDHNWYSPDMDKIEVIPFTLSYEAEAPANTLSGEARVSDSPKASGGQKVGYLNGGSSLTFNGVTAPVAGDYKITVAYISGDPRSFYVSSNGGAEQYYEVPKTADWDTVGTYELTLALNEGVNTITFTDGNWYAPDLDRIIVEPAVNTGPENPGEEEWDLGTPGSTQTYGAITVTDYTYGLLVTGSAYEVSLNSKTGLAGYSWADGQKLEGVYSSMKTGGSLIDSKGYESHASAGAPVEIQDGFGKGIELAMVHTSPGKPVLKQVYKFYEDKDYFLTRLDAVSDTGIETHYMSPVTVKRAGGVSVGTSADNRVLTVPFDNDAWIRYKSQTMNRADTSYELTAIFNNATRSGLVLGSVTHDTWKTGIDWKGSANQLNELAVYGGAASEVTRDTQPHGSLTGTEVSSPLIMVGGFSDYRTGLEEYGRANAVIAPPLALNPALPQGVPVGWNSWGAYESSLSYQDVVDVSNYFKENLQKFSNNGNVFINMDSYWDNLNDRQLADAVAVIKGNGQHAGIYWGPFVYWGNNMNQPVEGTNNQYTYGDIVLKDAAGQPLPTLDGAYPLDVTHPGAQLRMNYFLDKFKSLGFTYIKLDFLTHGSLEGQHYNPEVTTGIQAYNEGMGYVRDRLDGSMFISESIAPIFPSQYAHSRRISCDSFGRINETEYMLNSLTYGFWQNGTIYSYTDPDHLALSRAASLTEARSRMNSGVIAGTVLLDSDDVNDAKAQEYMTALYNNTDILGVALKGQAFKPLEGNTNANAADTFVLQDGSDYYLAVFNYSATAPAEKNVNLARAGLDAAEFYTMKDLWTGQTTSITGSWALTLQPAESKLVKLTKVAEEPGNPEHPGNPEPENPGNPDGNGNNGNNGNNGSNNGGNNSNSIDIVSSSSASGSTVTQTPADGTLTLTPDMLALDQAAGRVVVELKAEVQEIQLSSAVIRKLADHTLEVKSGKLALQIPAELLRQLLNKLPENQREDSVISLNLVPPGSKGADSIAAAAGSLHAEIALKGDIYTFSLSAAATSGAAETLSAFNPPVTLSLAAAGGFDVKRGGLYYIADNGKLEYIKAEYRNGVLTAKVSHFSTYAVLELNRSFADVPEAHWASAVIQELAAKLLIQGTGADKFEPGRTVTRAEFTAMLVHSLGLSAAGEADFKDVAPDAWYADAVSIAYKAGIISGRAAERFEPDARVTREEAAVMLMQAYELNNGVKPESSLASAFDDLNLVSPWAESAVLKAAGLRLVQGQAPGQFAPKGNATRAEAAQLIYNLLNAAP
ncbi:S-layer homology domain-containing protein [Paenibacillus sp. MMS20-IR301]|uniref:S-layer homology domain-containing protein n=1 Tax=Paenibacillus sp. MMS20-IR301 TaxID=2895946 RepID=UPI0028E98C24|nr:S-layer homology domain-containing protein [Paenibacillus sp. MMS20-IR301]WNS46710.1 S-layer homology domain-containing protein [Paenibacillus sp. MMS20-IR301]